MTRQSYNNSRQVIDITDFATIDFDEEVEVRIPKFAWVVARSYLSVQAQRLSSYATEYFTNGYTVPSAAQMDTIKANLAEFIMGEEMTGFLVGQISMYGGSFLPEKFLWCNGQTFDALVYTELFSVIGYTYGVDGGDPKTPDLYGRFPFGANISHPRGEEGGAETETLTEAQMPAHTHGPWYYGHNDLRAPMPGGGYGAVYATTGGRWAQLNPDSDGNNQAHDNMPPYLAIPFMIYAGQ